jgi:site-specific DNA-methyltransferase (adenine-specific)
VIDLHCGDCVAVLAALDVQVDAVVTDPPYGLGFMGKQWDGVTPPSAVWRAVLERLRPGGYLLAFGGTRTYHRLAVAIEDAGFEIRDCLVWLYGTGFPKSKACLKPAWEPIVLARRPGPSRPLGIDRCRIGTTVETWPRTRSHGSKKKWFNSYADKEACTQQAGTMPSGRWPANAMLDEAAAAMLDEQAGERAAGNHPRVRQNIGYKHDANGTVGERRPTDAGGASRFFYCPKASRSDRNADTREIPKRKAGVGDDRPCDDFHERLGDAPVRPAANHHPTVKPTDLMRWLVRLVAAPGEVVLDPFMGSGSTGKAAILEYVSFVGIEIDREYFQIAERRIKDAQPMLAFGKHNAGPV